MPEPESNQTPQPLERPDRLEDLQQRLYKRDAESPKLRRTRLSEAGPGDRQGWPDSEPEESTRSKTKMLKIIFWVAVLLFVISAAAAAWVFLQDSNTVSSGNVDLEVVGPLTIQAGEISNFQVEIANRNNSPLEFVDLIVNYPSGTLAADETGRELGRERETLGTIPAGETVRRELRASLFGERNGILPVGVGIEYRLVGSNAIFDKRVTYEVTVGASPLSLTMEAPEEVNTNQEMALDVEVISNSETALIDTLVTLEYPPGFRLTQAEPASLNQHNVWRLPKLEAGETWSLYLIGTLEGQDDESKTFRARAGMPSANNSEVVGALYGTDVASVAIRRPYVSLAASINGDPASEYIGSSRQSLGLAIEWFNNLPVAVTDGEIIVELDGETLERSSVSPGLGFYQSSGNRVLWNKNSTPVLSEIAPGERGGVSLDFNSVSLTADDNYQFDNPEINLLIKFRGRRATESEIGDQIETEVRRLVKLNTVLQSAAKVLYNSGPFTNSGPLPPKIGQETTYTVVWTAVNSTNDLAGAKMEAVLPPYVRWLGEVSPGTEDVDFLANASGGGAITWELGEIKAGTGYNLAAREVAFRIALDPSLNHVGSAPNLLSRPSITARDVFTGRTINDRVSRDLDTNLNKDPQFSFGQDKVVQ
ncbi:MAG: hypothetical protein U9M92_03270 [Patescibacteria group bacterium]|nr:hypothetical protein [Patescibacteria group bacterium]